MGKKKMKCPGWKECQNVDCHHRKKHKRKRDCGEGNPFCPACVEVEKKKKPKAFAEKKQKCQLDDKIKLSVKETKITPLPTKKIDSYFTETMKGILGRIKELQKDFLLNEYLSPSKLSAIATAAEARCIKNGVSTGPINIVKALLELGYINEEAL